ncbi:MarR family winged helix-turn-helix transcriptional regulator [Rhodococcus oryzae]|uniref:MarR family winged helix-turn-helix transcriptional regulator n=1 Tax=Rhodococcus oryzae TaxID=2571143 RepID=UPI00371A5277
MGTEGRPAEGSLTMVHRLRALAVELHLLGAEFGRVHGLHSTDVRALICLLDAERSGHPATPSWLGQQLHLNSASVTALIDRMEKAGHVRRQRDSQDRRRLFVEVTSEAVEVGWSFFGPVIANAVAAIGTYSAQEMETVDKFLADMQAAVESARREPDVD